MPRQSTCRLAAVIFLVLCRWVATAGPAPARELVFVADPWCPYNCEPGSDLPGLVVEVLEQAFTPEGYEVVYQVMPWARAIEEARRGEFTGIIGAALADAPDFVYHEIPVIMAMDEFFVRPGYAWRFQGLASFDSICLGAIKDYAYDDFKEKYIDLHADDPGRIFLATGEDPLAQLIPMLVNGRVDAVVEDRGVMRDYLRRMTDPPLLQEAGQVTSEAIYVAFSPALADAADLARILDRTLQEMSASGALQALAARYGLDPAQLGPTAARAEGEARP